MSARAAFAAFEAALREPPGQSTRAVPCPYCKLLAESEDDLRRIAESGRCESCWSELVAAQNMSVYIIERTDVHTQTAMVEALRRAYPHAKVAVERWGVDWATIVSGADAHDAEVRRVAFAATLAWRSKIASAGVES